MSLGGSRRPYFIRQQKFRLSRRYLVMRTAPRVETDSSRTIPVLSVSPIEEDHRFLEDIFSNYWTPYAGSHWMLHRSLSLESALTALQKNQIPIVISDSDLLSGTWKDMLAQIKLLPS